MAIDADERCSKEVFMGADIPCPKTFDEFCSYMGFTDKEDPDVKECYREYYFSFAPDEATD